MSAHQGTFESQPPGDPPSGQGLPARAVAWVGAHPGAALGVIVVLLVVILYTYARSKQWLGLGGPRAGRKGGKNGKKKPRGDDDEPDPETEKLIDSINGAE